MEQKSLQNLKGSNKANQNIDNKFFMLMLHICI